ncbi:MAG: hypothetical protein ACTSX7_11750 [Alphaproteobacteria bacterium]
MTAIFVAQAKTGYWASLDLHQFDRHISAPKHSGAAQTSVFEIMSAIEDPQMVIPSHEPGREMHIREVGSLNSRKFYTLVVVNVQNAQYAEIVTAYNVNNYPNRDAIWQP